VPMSDETRRRIVGLYRAGVRLDRIIEVVGTTAIYGALRRSGIEPGRQQRLRNPRVRREREEYAVSCLRRAAADLGVDVLKVLDYRRWRAANGEGPSESILTQLFGSWTKAVHAARLRHGNDGQRLG